MSKHTQKKHDTTLNPECRRLAHNDACTPPHTAHPLAAAPHPALRLQSRGTVRLPPLLARSTGRSPRRTQQA
eukprot:2660003-Prymnesium_polylepis.1